MGAQRDENETERHTVYVFETLELRRAAWITTGTPDYDLTEWTEVAFLYSHGVRLARLAWDESDVPTVGGGQMHILLEAGDHLGSTSVVVDKATGELVERGTYQAYGGSESDYRPERWKGFREDYGFTGKEEDVEVGLQYFGKRYYAPLLNRWASADPLAVHQSSEADSNLYAYAKGQSLRMVDPNGLDVVYAGRLTDKERTSILADMQKLTRDTLELHKRESGVFEVRIAKQAAPVKDGSQSRNAGTALIRALVSKQRTTRIDVVRDNESSTTSGNQTVREGPQNRARSSDALITLDQKTRARSFDQNPALPNSIGQIRDIERHIQLAHELVHASRFTSGPTAQGTVTRKFTDETGRLNQRS